MEGHDAERHTLIDGDGDLSTLEDPPIHEYFIIKQEVTLDVNFRDKRIDGTTDIFLVVFSDKIEEVALDAAHCEVDTKHITVTELREVNGEIQEGQRRKTTAEYEDPYSRLENSKGLNLTAEHHVERRKRARNVFYSRKADVPAEAREVAGCTPVYGSLKVNLRGKADQDRPRLIIRKSTLNPESSASAGNRQYKITIPFTNKNPRDGLHFVGVDMLDQRYTHMYTRHSIQPGTASCIFPCIDDHGSRCDWKISIKFPRTLGDALQKPLASQTNGVAPHHSDKMQVDEPDKSIDLTEEDKLREMTVICSGFLIEDKADPKDDRKKIMTFEPEKKTSVQKLGFAVGPFEHIDLASEFRSEEDEIKLGMSALRVHAYCLPGRAEWVRNSCVALTMAADYFSYTFAKYPFGNFKLCFLDDMVEDTVSLHSMAFASNRLLFPEDIFETEVDVTRKIIFTLAYQWTGINLIPNTRNDLWLVFGIAHYMTDLFMKRLCGNNEHRFRMKIMGDKLVDVDINRPSLFDLGQNLHLGEFEMDFMNLKAPLVFFILDKRLIKASGGQGMTRILARFLTKVQIESGDSSTILKTEDFKIRCEKAARYRLEAFWTQWVYGSGCPRFDVKAKFNKKRLCVELTLNQTQSQTAKKPELEKDDFLRAIRERRSDTPLGAVQPLFTGPMTVRIHEADGTPYEHILEIREDATRSTKFEIPYNTKYKRLKRTRRMKEKHTGAGNAEGGEGGEDALLYSLGDVLSTPEEQKQWELIDWDPDTERKMDQESYEWIRVDADFEWAADMKHTLEPYMYVSQLQQDRDVVAQQDAMLYLTHGPLHPIASGFLVKTLVDKRYFHGIRTMAAEALPRQANIKDLPMLGLRQLMMAYRDMFCYENTNQPKPNNFTDKQQYNVRRAIIKAIAQVRDSSTHRCPLEARQFILDQLLLNNNEDNPFSDHHWISLLVEAVATSLIPSKKDEWLERQRKTQNEEEKQFLDSAIEQIERVLRRDEWTNSYQNIWTIAGLDAKQRLMKAEVIPKKYADFGQYLLDGTADSIRIKCFDALIDLGAMTDASLFTFLLYVLTTDRSPFVRGKLIQAISRGLAAIAFGEYTKVIKDEPQTDDADPLLVVQDSEKEVEARREMFARKENLDSALKALRKEMDETYVADERHYKTAMRKALDHGALGRADVEGLLDIAAMMFDEAQSWIMTLILPKVWSVSRAVEPLTKRLMMTFTPRYRIKPKEPLKDTIAAPAPPKPPMPLARAPSIKINTKGFGTPRPSISGPSDSPTINATPARKPSITVAKSSATADVATPSAKRPLPDHAEATTSAAKRAKTETPGPSSASDVKKPSRKMVTLKTKDPKRLALALGKKFSPAGEAARRTSLPSIPKKEPTPDGVQDSIVAKPVRKPLPGGDSVRKPLPGGGSSMSPPPPPQQPPKMTINTNARPSAGSKSASPAPPTPGSATNRPKIKIIRKSQPGPSQSPPAP